MAEPSLASNNPFRRKNTVPTPTSAATAAAAAFSASSSPSSFFTSTTAAASSSPATETHSSAFVSNHASLSSSTHRGDPFSVDSGVSANSGASAPTSIFAQEERYQLQQQQQQQPQQQHLTGDAFRDQLRALPKSAAAPPSTTFLKPKPVKKVRVQSPPPPSPDSVDSDLEDHFSTSFVATGTAAITRFGSSGGSDGGGGGDGGLESSRLPVSVVRAPYDDDYSSESESSEADNTTTTIATTVDRKLAATLSAPNLASPLPTQPRIPPANPFQKTLEEVGVGSAVQAGRGISAAGESPVAVGKGALDVDAFRRLLLTGQTGGGLLRAPGGAAGAADAASMTDASSVSKHSVFDAGAHPLQETPRTSHEISETDDDRSGLILAVPPQAPGLAQRQTLRKKPPPPSSRHGKLIKAQKDKDNGKDNSKDKTKGGEEASPLASPSSDVNKPLPPPPTRRAVDEDIDSIFDREAAGKLPELDLDPDVSDDAMPVAAPRPPTPPNASHSAPLPSSARRISSSGSGTETLTSLPSPRAALAASAPLPTTTTTTKSVPAPPPRRQARSKSEGKADIGHERPSPAFTSDDRAHEQQQQQQQEHQHHHHHQNQHRDRSPMGSPRSSLDSARSRPASIKLTANAPAPPPPRRAHHASRPSNSLISPSAMSFASPSLPSASLSPSVLPENDRPPATWLGTTGSGLTGGETLTSGAAEGVSLSASVSTPALAFAGELASPGSSSTLVPTSRSAKPPPPPTRNASMRQNKDGRPALPGEKTRTGSNSGRPSSLMSVDAISRRVGQPHLPPPPPPRQRGSSRGSIDVPEGGASTTTAASAAAAVDASRRRSSDCMRRLGTEEPTLAEENEEREQTGAAEYAGGALGIDASGPSANDILADLNALQREVDALRGQYGKP
ncbi:hypothetical protein SPI_02056 [Niveomyces insectorum RCEF 264]|uniref:Uncharacterized protein n=1 Tax=Niveomyces insectorum RCEF 264 TaxID=1081102 RepID=A0A167XQN7_9HYPO|nr:hypothetical protein SPI_02056 [Niveomyces insectorum RCEF 264]